MKRIRKIAVLTVAVTMAISMMVGCENNEGAKQISTKPMRCPNLSLVIVSQDDYPRSRGRRKWID